MSDTHSLVRPGDDIDLYYYDAETSKKQAFPTIFDTRFIQNFQALSGGSSTFLIPPANGMTDILLNFSFVIPGAPTNIALPRAWAYALIDRVSYRFGGSSTYFLSGDQLLQNALRAQPNKECADAILTLGGNSTAGGAVPAVVYGSVVMTLPSNKPTGVGKQNPFPLDLLTQSCQITVELKQPGSIWTNQSGGALPAQCNTLATGQFQVAQLSLNNQGDALARRADMSVNAYAYPATFVQNIQRISVPQSTLATQSVNLVGFRAGEVTEINMWLTRTADTSNATTGINPFRWYLPTSLTVNYAGQQYSRFENGSSALWNLVNGNKPPAVENVVLTGAGGAVTTASELSQYVVAPFAQPLADDDAHHILIHGKPIVNGIVTVDIATPSAQSDWILNVSYVYNTTLLFSQGTVDFVM